MKYIKNIILFTAVAAVTFASCSTAANEEKKPTENNAATPTKKEVSQIPVFTMKDDKGNNVDLQSLKGKKIFVNIWASWCPPCRVEMPSIAALHTKADKEKVVFVMLSLDENMQSSIDFMKESNIDLPIYFPAENLPNLFNGGSIPASFIFDETGKIIKQSLGADNYDTEEYIRLLKS